jgi:hypothetical protein
MAISAPTQSQINVVSTTSDYSQKVNLKEQVGSYLDQAVTLVYDDILRFQAAAANPTADISNFKYNAFEGNAIWFMDELVGIESDWKKYAETGIEGNTAYSYVQFTDASVDTAVNMYVNHIERFNKRKDTRNWQPYGIPLGTQIAIPSWVNTLKNSKKSHKKQIDALSYDQQLALAFVHMHKDKSRDANFVLLSTGDVTGAKDLYKNNHHTNPDLKTLLRLNTLNQTGRDIGGNIIAGSDPGFFRIHYVAAPEIVVKPVEIVKEPLLTEVVTAEVIIDSWYVAAAKAIKAFFGDK